jgi:uncharacterized protein (DUF433 family)
LEETPVIDERMVTGPNICHRQPCVEGTDMPAHQVVRTLAEGMSAGEFPSEHPFLIRHDILACLDYDAGLAEEQEMLLPATGH